MYILAGSYPVDNNNNNMDNISNQIEMNDDEIIYDKNSEASMNGIDVIYDGSDKYSDSFK